MRVLGIDPGYGTIGWGILDCTRGKLTFVDYGAIRTAPQTPMEDRLVQIYGDLEQIIRNYRVETAAFEELFFNTNITTGISVAHARGVILLAAYRAGVRVFEYTPLQVKQAVVGYGRAEKKQVIDMVKRILNLPSAPKPDDAADAVALAICHARSSTSLLSRKEDEGLCSTI